MTLSCVVLHNFSLDQRKLAYLSTDRVLHTNPSSAFATAVDAAMAVISWLSAGGWLIHFIQFSTWHVILQRRQTNVRI